MAIGKLAHRTATAGTLAVLVMLSVSLIGSSPIHGGTLSVRACFDDVGGLQTGDPVFIAGVTVGRVAKLELDEDYRACAHLRVDPKLKLARDTSASILSRGVLGDRCVDLMPGGSDAYLQEGDEIAFTQNALVIERVVGRFLMELGSGRE